MIILTVRTDSPEAEIGVYKDRQQLAYKKWHADRQLAETLHQEIHKLLQSQQLDWGDIQGAVCYKGPGSFTGLRIGAIVVNTLGYSLAIPVVASDNTDWIETGVSHLLAGEDQKIVNPEYGSPPHITQPKK